MTRDPLRRIVASPTWLGGGGDRPQTMGPKKGAQGGRPGGGAGLQPRARKRGAKVGGRGADALEGVWIGPPLHPVLTDLPVGGLTTAVTLDVIGSATGSRTIDRQADGALAVAVASSVVAAVTGISDWRYLRGENRRLAAGHGLLNVLGLVCNATSVGLRFSGRRRAGRVASGLGTAIAGAAAHLGGELTFEKGVRVDAARSE